MSNNSNAILDKIRKLMALGQSPNENEAMVALAKARELMLEYKISQGEVDAHEIRSKKFVERQLDTWCTKYNDPWLMTLANKIARAHCCDSYLSHYRGQKKIYMVIVGFEDDVNMAEIAFYYAMDCLYTTLRYKYRVWKTHYESFGYRFSASEHRDLKDSYARGFIAGIEKCYNKQQNDNQEMGLILVTPQEVVDFMAQITGTITSVSRRVDHNEWNQGFEDGKKFDTNRVTNGAKQLASGQ